MMSSITLDTTVLARGILPPRRRKKDAIYENEFRLHVIAKSILSKVESKESIMNAPSAAIVEIAAVGARLTGKEERGIQASEYVKRHGNIIYDISLISEAVKVASQTKISGFDAIFITCAKVTDSILITDDKNMYGAAINIGIKAKLLRDMA